MPNDKNDITEILNDPSTIILIRHGDASSAAGRRAAPAALALRKDEDDTRFLTEAGERQALQAARCLQALLGNAPIALVSSGLVRARQTAQILAETMATEAPSVDHRFNEVEGAYHDGLPADAEDPVEVAARALEEHHARSRDERARLVIVTHGDILGYLAESLSPWNDGAAAGGSGERDGAREDEAEDEGYPPHDNCHITAVRSGVIRIWNMPPTATASH
jgi:broad specificity phosphatase PhoE